MNRLSNLFILILCLQFSACSNDDSVLTSNEVDNTVHFCVSGESNVQINVGSRAIKEDVFSNMQYVGIFGVDNAERYKTAVYQNYKYAGDGKGNLRATGIPVFPWGEESENRKLTFKAYYPYTNNVKFDENNVPLIPIVINSSSESTDDYMWASTDTYDKETAITTPVSLGFKHILGIVDLCFYKVNHTSGYNPRIRAVEIFTSSNQNSFLNVQTGELIPDNDYPKGSIRRSFSNGGLSMPDSPDLKNPTHEFMIIPGNIIAIEVVVDDPTRSDYLTTLKLNNLNVKVESGKKTIYKIKYN